MGCGLLALVGCNEQNLNRRIETDTFNQAPSNQVDILWVIDNSRSMAEEQASVAASAQDFVSNLESSGMDFHLGVITTDVDSINPDAGVLLGSPPVLDATAANYVSTFQQRVQVSTGGSDQEKGLQAAVTALTPPLIDSRNFGFLREDALLSIIILSDENDCSDFGALGAEATGEECYTESQKLTPVPDLVDLLRSTKEDPSRISVSGIIGPPTTNACVDTVPGHRYGIAIASFAGYEGDICQGDYGDIMLKLGLIAAGVLDTFALSYVPDPETIEVQVQPLDTAAYTVANDEVSGWTYIDDDTAPRVMFHGDSVPPRGALVSITYEVATSIQDPDTGITQ
jgi:hypothetical protein